jgi:hypothetical protein
MSAATGDAPVPSTLPRKRAARYACASAIDLVISDSSASHRIPGRLLNLSASGVAAAVAAELRPGHSVALEFQLPGASSLGRRDVLNIRAVVCHHGLLRCGLQFVGLTADQEKAIQSWITSQAEENPPSEEISRATTPVLARKKTLPVLRVLLAVCLVAAILGAWHWHRAWNKLESGPSLAEADSTPAPMIVPGEDMERLLLYRVEPVYPTGVNAGDVARLVILDAVIGPDGSVQDLHPISGPEELLPAAMDAVRLWRFQPYEVSGRPLRVETTVSVIFPEN